MDIARRTVVAVPHCLRGPPARARANRSAVECSERAPREMRVTERFRELTGEVADEAAALLRDCKTLQLATASAEGVPEASYAPFVRTEDGAFHICVSDLSRHTGHLVATGRASVLVIEDESGTTQLFTRRRLAFECRAEQIPRDGARWHAVMNLFQCKFGEVIALIRPLADFRLIALRPRRGTFVKGFGQAYRIERSALRTLRGVNDL